MSTYFFLKVEMSFSDFKSSYKYSKKNLHAFKHNLKEINKIN